MSLNELIIHDLTLSLILTFAPDLSNFSTIWQCRLSHARCRAVQPSCKRWKTNKFYDNAKSWVCDYLDCFRFSKCAYHIPCYKLIRLIEINQILHIHVYAVTEIHNDLFHNDTIHFLNHPNQKLKFNTLFKKANEEKTKTFVRQKIPMLKLVQRLQYHVFTLIKISPLLMYVQSIQKSH